MTIRLFQYQPVRYYTVSAVALAIDVSLFQALIWLGAGAILAASCSYLVAISLHFLVNRAWTFRARDRAVGSQVPAYSLVVATAWILTITVVGSCTGIWHMQPIVAKGIAVLVTLPIGFFGHKYVTYGPGIPTLLKMIRRHQPTNARAACGAMLLLGGLAISAAAPFLLMHQSGPCADFRPGDVLFVRLSAGMSMPIPIVQNCSHGAPLAALLLAGYAIAAAGTLFLVGANISLRFLIGLTVSALALALAVPFVPNADPYAYALYAYEAFVLRQSPYVVAHVHGLSNVSATLMTLFPDPRSPSRASNYGPAFTALYAALIGPFGFISLKAMIVAERVLGGACVVILGLLMAASQTQSDRKRQAFIAIALNPLVLLQSVSFAHGDIIMLVLLAAGYWAYRRGNLWVCAALCVLAAEVRTVALVATVVLIVDLLYRGRRAGAGVVVLTTLVLAGATRFAALRAFGAFRFAGPFFLPHASAPGTILASVLFAGTAASLTIGLLAQCGAALGLGYIALRQRLYSLAPIAILLALPVVEPWYAQWLAPISVLTPDRAYRSALIAFMLLAPGQMFVEMFAWPGMVTARELLVAALWVLPLFMYFRVRAIPIAAAERAAVPA